MRILCLETATDLGSVAVVVDGVVRAERSTPLRARLGETLLAEIERALLDAGLEARAIELCAVGTGPGSFTGLRVGLAVAKGLFLGLGTPIVGVATAWTLVRALDETEASVVAIDARKDEAFISCFVRGPTGLEVVLDSTHGPPRAMGQRARQALGDGVRAVVSGTGASATFLEGLGAPFERASAEHDHPRAAFLGPLAEAAFRARGADDPAALVPHYVRGADVTVPRAK